MRGVIYLDLDNFPAKTEYEKALEEFYSSDLRILAKKAFGDLEQLTKLPLETQQSYILIPCPKLTKTKNSTDMRLSVEIMKDLLTNPSIDLFIICSADTDYIPVMKEVKEHGKEVIILTNSTMNLNSALTDMADQIIVCESNKPKRDTHCRSKIAELLDGLFKKSKTANIMVSGINDYFVNNGYNFKTHGYRTFKQCMKQCLDKTKYEIDFESGLLYQK